MYHPRKSRAEVADILDDYLPDNEYCEEYAEVEDELENDFNN